MRNENEKCEVVAFRMPDWMRKLARKRCESEDVTFSQLMRRAARREMGLEAAVPPDVEEAQPGTEAP